MLHLKSHPVCVLLLFSFSRVGLTTSPAFPDENYTERSRQYNVERFVPLVLKNQIGFRRIPPDIVHAYRMEIAQGGLHAIRKVADRYS